MIKRILFCSPEVTPYAKTGGLADVSGALPAALREMGITCDVVMPLYGHIKARGLSMEHISDIFFPMGTGLVQAGILRHGDVYFVDNDDYFSRVGLYAFANQDFPDNLERFAFFSRACVELIHLLGAEIVHCNDWQTALIPAYMHALDIRDVPSIYTIHNMAYQGSFDASLWPLLFLPHDYFSPNYLEYYGCINVMKAGIVLADMVNTVSATYAREIQTQEFGCGLDGLLRSVAHKLTGIVNGIDIAAWDPAQDHFLTGTYDLRKMSGKSKCKTALQKQMHLRAQTDAPLFGLISRLVYQKGIDMVLGVIPEMIRAGAQIVVLGNGEGEYEHRLREMAQAFPEECAVHIGFDESLAHVIEAGSDFFLMPSRFEPCGLNQMISMRYGTIPIVTPVGGLMDTVSALGEQGEPTGIRIQGTDGFALSQAVRESIRIFKEDPKLLRQLRKSAMSRDVSWSVPAQLYLDLYSKQRNFKERARF